MTLVAGSAYVLVAQVPKAGDRWHQVHFNVDVAQRFFQLQPGDDVLVTLERVAYDGAVAQRDARKLVFSEANRNAKLEFDFDGVTAYPEDGEPLLLILEVDRRHFRYYSLFPGRDGYSEMATLNALLPSVGKGKRRVITTLDEIELRWQACPFRHPVSG